ncbi:hypothetical protein FLL45_20855 [Aliikangiella marina]|uniref:Uncharacterized protein n=1 Tax=Aliikangiella marina TaxID=1712262 RepID=A0A545T311_9GAMM|nr:hypothetical protein [Aliikangiella marina]TQV71602.1 hypothetical protein FLL45_20855 [Aliikangiella marina]
MDLKIVKNIVVTFSIVWVVFWVLYGVSESSNLKESFFNEWGDFFAGTAAPLAFAWLVLGYFQQGKELSENTDTLKQQITKLEESLDLQRQLVEATKEEMNVYKEKIRKDEERYYLENQPRFVWLKTKKRPMSIGDLELIMDVSLKNIQAEGYEIVFSIKSKNLPWVRLEFNSFPVIMRGQEVKISFALSSKDIDFREDILVDANYISRFGKPETQLLDFRFNESGDLDCV